MRFRSWSSHGSIPLRYSAESTPKVCTQRRDYDALGHRRGQRWYCSTQEAKDAPVSSLWGSGGLLFLQQPSSGVPQLAHVAQSPEGRCVRARWPAGGEFHRLATFGGEEVISGPYHCTHLHCRRADADDRSIGSRMAADLHRKVAPSTVLPVTACDRCELRLWSRSAQAQDLPRLQRARGWPRRPPSRDPKTRKSTFHFCVRERVKSCA